MKAYKAFRYDWKSSAKSRNGKRKQYAVGRTYSMKSKPIVCQNGMHFCYKLIDVFRFYPLDPFSCRVAEIEVLGDVAEPLYRSPGTKACTNKLKIVREVSWDEVIEAIENDADAITPRSDAHLSCAYPHITTKLGYKIFKNKVAAYKLLLEKGELE